MLSFPFTYMFPWYTNDLYICRLFLCEPILSILFLFCMWIVQTCVSLKMKIKEEKINYIRNKLTKILLSIKITLS